jgi:hypothetical protein
MVFDANGNLYVSCWGTSTVSKINTSGTVTNVWSVGTSVWPAGIVLDAAGNIFTANYNNATISKITPSGTVTQVYATLASGSYPFFLAKDAAENLYNTNMGNGTVSKISAPIFYTNSSGQMVSLSNASSVISPEGGANFGRGRDVYGKLYNTLGVTTTNGSVGTTSSIVSGVISPTNAISSSIGIVYSTDINFGTYTSATIQSNVAAGSYSTTITGLASSTTYYAKAFVTNSAGTNYGNVVNFTTATPSVPASFSFSSSNLSGNLPNYYIAANNLTLSQLPTSWTIQWTYRMDQSSASADGMHWFFRNPSTTGKYSTDMHLYQINGMLQFWYNGNTYAFNATYQDILMNGLTQNSTYKLALTYDGTTLKLYSDGVLKSTYTLSITLKPTNSTLRMGSNLAQTIDEFRIWDTALTSTQILANQGTSVAGNTGLMLYYNFNEGTASGNNTAITRIIDQSGNNRHGTFNNVALTGSTNNYVTSIVTGF